MDSAAPNRHPGKAPVLLAAVAVAAALANAVLLAQAVPDQASRLLAFGLILAAGPAILLLCLAIGRLVPAAVALAVFFAGSVLTGFTVGFWDLLVAVPLCVAAVALAFARKRRLRPDMPEQ